jgi:hypothetical protein
MSINSIMLVGLGFLVATLLAVLIAPAYRNRTMRLTAEALRRSLPLSETEIRAEHDRMRAEHAIRIHNLEAQLEKVTLDKARQKIEVNRRDARISELEGIAVAQKSQLDELENAKRVLEQTVTDRLPKIEGRLGEARRLLQQRDSEVTTLAQTAQRQARAIAEATQINQQQAIELDQLKTTLSTRAARNQDTFADARFDGEVALRSELEALRAKSRDQTLLIERLQRVIANPASGAEPGIVEAVSSALGASRETAEEAEKAELVRLRGDVFELQGALAIERAKAAALDADLGGQSVAEAEVARLRATNQDLATRAAELQASLEAYEPRVDAGGGADRKPADSALAFKAKAAAAEARSKEQSVTIATLRAEVAALNERLARQANHYMDEMRRLGAGTVQTSGPGAGPQRGMAAADAAAAKSSKRREPRRSLSDRISEPRVVQLTPVGDKRRGRRSEAGAVAAGHGDHGSAAGASAAEMAVEAVHAEAMPAIDAALDPGRARTGDQVAQTPLSAVLAADAVTLDDDAGRLASRLYAVVDSDRPEAQNGDQPSSDANAAVGPAADEPATSPSSAEPERPLPRRSRLLDRITEIDKTSG